MYPQHPNKPPPNLMDPSALQLSTGLPVIPNVSIDLPAPILDLSGLQFGLPELPPIDLNMPVDFCEQYFDNVIDLSAKKAQAAFLNAQKVHAQVQLLRSLDKSRNVGTSSSSPGYIVEMPESPKKQGSSSTIHQIEQSGPATASHFSINEITDDSNEPQSISSNNDGVNLNTTNNVAQPVPLDNKSSSNASRIQLLESIDSSSAEKGAKKNDVVASPKPKPMASQSRPPTQSSESLKEKVVAQTVRKIKENEQDVAISSASSSSAGNARHPAPPQIEKASHSGVKSNITINASVVAPLLETSSSGDSHDKSIGFHDAAQRTQLDSESANDATLVQSLQPVGAPSVTEAIVPSACLFIQSPGPPTQIVSFRDICELKESFHSTKLDSATSDTIDDAQHLAHISSNNNCASLNTTNNNNVAQPVSLDNKSSSIASPIQILESIDSSSAQKKAKTDNVEAPPKLEQLAPHTLAVTETPVPLKEKSAAQIISEIEQCDHVTRSPDPSKEEIIAQIVREIEEFAHVSTLASATSDSTGYACPLALLENNSSSKVYACLENIEDTSSSDCGEKANSFEDAACFFEPPTPKPVATITRPSTQLSEPLKDEVFAQIVREPEEVIRIVSSSSHSGGKSKSFNDGVQRTSLDSESASDDTPVERLSCVGTTSMTKAMASLTSLPTQSQESPKQKGNVQTICENKQNDHAAKLGSATPDIIDNVQHLAHISSNNYCVNLNTTNVVQPAPLDSKSSINASRIQLLESTDSSSAQKEAKKDGVVAPSKPKPLVPPTLHVTESPDPSKERIIAQVVHEIKEKDLATTFASATSGTTGNVRHLAPLQKISSSNDCSNMNIVAGSPMSKSMTSRTRPYTQSSETPKEKDVVQNVSGTKQKDDATTLASATSDTTDDAKHAASPKKASSSIDCSIESQAPKVQEITSIFDDHEQIDLAIAFAFATMDSSTQDTRSTNDVENSNFCSEHTKNCSNVSVTDPSPVLVDNAEIGSSESFYLIDSSISSESNNTDVVTTGDASMKNEQEEKHDSLNLRASKSSEKKSVSGSNSDTRVTTDFFAAGPAKNTRSRRASLVTQASNLQTVGSGRKRTIDNSASALVSAPSKPNRKKDAPVKSKTTKKSAYSHLYKSARSSRVRREFINTDFYTKKPEEYYELTNWYNTSGPIYPCDIPDFPTVSSQSRTKEAKLVNKKRDPRPDVASNSSPVLLTSSERKRVIYVADDSDSNSTSATSKPFKKSDPRGKSKKASEKEPGPTGSLKGTRLSGVRVEPRGSLEISESVPSKSAGPSRETSSNTSNRDADTSPEASAPNYSVPLFKRPRMDYHLSSYSNLDLWNAILRSSAIPMPFGRVNVDVPTLSTTQPGSSGEKEEVTHGIVQFPASP